MKLIESLVIWLEQLQGKLQFFVATLALMGVLLAGSSFIAWKSSREQQALTVAYVETLKVLRAANEVKVATLETLRGERGYLLTRDPEQLRPYHRGRYNLIRAVNQLESKTRHNPVNASTVRELRQAVADYLTHVDIVVRKTRPGQTKEALALVRRNGASQAIDRIDILNDTLTERERNTLRSLTRHAATVTNQFLSFVYLLSFAGLVLLVMAAMSAAALRRSFRREQTYREELRRRAETDDLTGVANRRQFLTSLQRAIDSARASNRPLAFALIDLDNFKRVNDNHGHAAGDEVLRQIAETSLATIREGDLFGRLGGEEFGLILPMTAEQHAMLVCERLREQVHGQVIELNCGVRVSMTMSAGIAQLRPSDTISSLMEQADRALYLAKRGGRDQVKLATSEGLAAAQELNAPIALEQIKKQPRSFTAIAF